MKILAYTGLVLSTLFGGYMLSYVFSPMFKFTKGNTILSSIVIVITLLLAMLSINTIFS